ncbi:MAG: hypothetical protein Q7S06_01760 [Nanoarchaeota archaeon]|nr:hypothetical protein [Nanoarchaeota archaeon]
MTESLYQQPNAYFVPESGKVCFNLRRFKRIVPERQGDCLIERIMLNDRVLSIFSRKGRLDIYERRYYTNNPQGRLTHFVTRRLGYDVTPEEALVNARESILYGLAKLEVENREREFDAGLSDYLRGYAPVKTNRLQSLIRKLANKKIEKKTEGNEKREEPEDNKTEEEKLMEEMNNVEVNVSN